MRSPLVLAVAVAVLSVGAPDVAAAPVVHSTVTERIKSVVVPRSFVGISDEYPTVPARAGNPALGPNEPMVALFDLLARAGGGPPFYRVGGGTTDTSWFAPVRPARPSGADYAITQPWLDQLREFVRQTASPLILGLNLGLGRVSLATEWAKAALKALPRSTMFELGNEPNSFVRRTLKTRPVRRMRPRGYSPKRYQREVHRFLAALARVRPRPRVIGPAIDAEFDWVASVPGLVRRERRRLAGVSMHRYPLNACGARPGSRGYPRPRQLLSDHTATEPVRLLSAVVKAVRKLGKPVRVTESNSVACGGAKGVSDTFASALWGANWLFEMASIGMSGVAVHATSPEYAPFITGAAGGRWAVQVNPLYYGMLAFTETVGRGGRILPWAYFTARAPGNGNIKVWAVRDPAKRQIRALVIHMGPKNGTAFLRIPGAARTATVKRLLAPSIRSKSNITWGGQTFARPTFDGALTGDERLERAQRRRRSTFRLRMRAGSAALLTVSVSGH